MASFDNKNDILYNINSTYHPDVNALTRGTMMTLIMRIAFIIFTYFMHAYIILGYCIFSAILIVSTIPIIHRKHFNLHNIIVFVDSAALAVICLFCLGWQYGFQLYFFSFTITAFFIDYNYNKGTKIQWFTKLSLALYVFIILGSYTWYIFNEPIYTFPPAARYTIMYLNILQSLAIIMAFSGMFINTVYGLQTKLRDMAILDPLTGLLNRRSLNDKLGELHGSFQEDKHYGMAMFDIDFFKKINDTYGHDAGDAVLVGVSDVLKEMNHEDLIAARYGGEEFLVLTMADTKEQVKAKYTEVFNRICSNTVECNGVTLSITITMGVIFYEAGRPDAEALKTVDNLLYEGKNSGRNQIIFEDR